MRLRRRGAHAWQVREVRRSGQQRAAVRAGVVQRVRLECGEHARLPQRGRQTLNQRARCARVQRDEPARGRPRSLAVALAQVMQLGRGGLCASSYTLQVSTC